MKKRRNSFVISDVIIMFALVIWSIVSGTPNKIRQEIVPFFKLTVEVK